jgi:hypothetical protein
VPKFDPLLACVPARASRRRGTCRRRASSCGQAHALDFATSHRVDFKGRAGAAIQVEIDRHVTSALPRSKGRQPNRPSAMIREVGWDFALDVADAEQDAAIAVDEPSVQLLGCPEFYH